MGGTIRTGTGRRDVAAANEAAAGEWLLARRRCPSCSSDVVARDDAVVCRSCAHRYRYDDGVPRMLVDGTGLDFRDRPGPLTRLLHAVVARPCVYDVAQAALGGRVVAARLAPLLDELQGTVLDLGAGTGAWAGKLPAGVSYVWLDADTKKLRGFRRRAARATAAVLADATCVPLAGGSVDHVLCVAVSHHLDDQGLEGLFEHAARVARTSLVFADAVASPGSRASAALWRYDRGAHARTERRLLDAIGTFFHVRRVERFAFLHRYIACVAVPKTRTARE